MFGHEPARVHEKRDETPCPEPTGLPVRPTYRRLTMAGFSPSEAGNLTAHLSGLRSSRSPWTLREIESLLFLRDLVERGRLQP
jgi:hypothetical protein